LDQCGGGGGGRGGGLVILVSTHHTKRRLLKVYTEAIAINTKRAFINLKVLHYHESEPKIHW
jgi:hypothetical protein